MSHNIEASSSSPPSSPIKKIACKDMTKLVDRLLNEDFKRLREQVESVKNVNILIFYSRIIFTALEAVDAIVNKLKIQNLFPVVEDTDVLSLEPFAYEYYFKKACDITKEIRKMFSNAISTRSPANSRGGGSKKVLKWKNQCDKNMEKIEFLIKDAFLRDYHTWFDVFALYGAFNAVALVFVSSYNILKSRESEDDENFKDRAEGIFEKYLTLCRDLTCVSLGKFVEKVKEHNKLLEEAKLKGPQAEQDVLRKFQDVDDMMKTVKAKVEDEELLEAKSLNKFQEVETLVKIHEVDFQKKLQKLVMQNKLLKAETERKKLQEVETQKKSQEEEALKKLREEEALKKFQEEDWQEKIHADEVPLKKLEGATLKKLQEEETQKNSQEAEINMELLDAEINKKLHEDEALKKLEEEKNTVAGDETMEF